MEKVKKVIVALLIVLFVAFAILDFWWLYVLIFAPDKEIVNTFHVGTITTVPDEDGQTETEYVVKVKYFSNQNKNGLECLEIEFSGFVDENSTQIYSWGMQFVANSEDDSLENWIYNVDKSSVSGVVKNKWQFPLTWRKYHNIWGSYVPSNSNIFYYKSSDKFANDITGASSLGNGEGFLISIDEDIYKLNFNGNIIEDDNSNFVAEKMVDVSGILGYVNVTVYDYYYSFDIYNFAYTMYEQIQAVANGKHSASLINLPDMFSYQKFDGKAYVDVSENENAKVSETVRNFYSIYIEKSADGVSQATDSMFKCVNGTPQFNLSEEDEGVPDAKDYFIGNTVVNCDIYDFDFVNVRDNLYCLKLNEKFINFYSSYADKIKLSISINLDDLKEKGIVFGGFTKDSNLSKFKVSSCSTLETIDGEIVITEVDYA